MDQDSTSWLSFSPPSVTLRPHFAIPAVESGFTHYGGAILFSSSPSLGHSDAQHQRFYMSLFPASASGPWGCSVQDVTEVLSAVAG
jgi:hypothetical protein